MRKLLIGSFVLLTLLAVALTAEAHGARIAAGVSFGFPGADDLGNMFQFKCDFQQDFCGARDVDFARSLNPELQNFASWLSCRASQIPLG